MATVGDKLTAPETGWTRYDDTNENFTYTGTWTRYDEKTNEIYKSAYNESLLYATSQFAMVSFNFIGTKLRVIANPYSNKPSDINICIDDVVYTFSEYGTIQQDFQRLCFEKSDLENKEHSVKISYSNLLSGNWDFDAIDIDETGELKPYTPIAAPTNLTATAGDSQVTLSWTAVDGATSYIVKRSTTSGGTYETIASGVTDTSYIDTSVTNGTTYYYVVVAVNDDGESNSSNEASATPVDNSKFLLRVTMLDSSERDYQLSTTEIDDFVTWFNSHTSTSTTSYMLAKKVGTQNSKEYLSFDKIISFEVIEIS